MRREEFFPGELLAGFSRPIFIVIERRAEQVVLSCYTAGERFRIFIAMRRKERPGNRRKIALRGTTGSWRDQLHAEAAFTSFANAFISLLLL